METKKVEKIEFNFRGRKWIHEFFFGIKDGVNGFGIKDERGVWHDCLLKDNQVEIYGQDSDYLKREVIQRLYSYVSLF